MELYLDTEKFNHYYNCALINPDSVPLRDRQHIIFGFSVILLSIGFVILYIPCVCIIATQTQHSCYKFMFVLGIVNITNLFVWGVTEGIFAINGDVFCTQPFFIFWCGHLMCVLWYAETGTECLLATNRFLSLCNQRLGERMFEGKKGWLYLLYPLALCTYVFLFVPPYMFNSIRTNYFENPFVGYLEDWQLNPEDEKFYHFQMHFVYDLFVSFCLAIVHIGFGFVLYQRRNQSFNA